MVATKRDASPPPRRRDRERFSLLRGWDDLGLGGGTKNKQTMLQRENACQRAQYNPSPSPARAVVICKFTALDNRVRESLGDLLRVTRDCKNNDLHAAKIIGTGATLVSATTIKNK